MLTIFFLIFTELKLIYLSVQTGFIKCRLMACECAQFSHAIISHQKRLEPALGALLASTRAVLSVFVQHDGVLRCAALAIAKVIWT